MTGANEIIPLINRLRKNQLFDFVIMTRDWHPATHGSFAANNPGQKVFTVFRLPDTGVDQMMWPVHCVAGTHGSKFHPALEVKPSDIIVEKGKLDRVDSYSGFGSFPEVTELEKVLRENNVNSVYCVGLAYDYCVGSTAIDAAHRHFNTYLIKDATRSVSADSEMTMTARLHSVGVKIINSEQLNLPSLNKRASSSSSQAAKASPVIDEDEKAMCLGSSTIINHYDPYDHLPKSTAEEPERENEFHQVGW